jgi:hypothetical protein
VTDAPIYLVSACGSGEEFVAAFRRYADKNGLFVPIAEPLAAGQRTRFAVTLRDGGVMVEGEAEIVSSARTASVLHGRVGMTLKFVEPDAPSKTTLGELEKARLSMRPPPPSVPPRPASVPAEPRPVPPPVQGRIDATNALAECVAIAAPERLEALALARPAGKFVVPPIAPARAKPATSPPADGAAPSTLKPTVAARPLARPPGPLPALQQTGSLPALKPTGTLDAPAQVPAIQAPARPSVKAPTGPVPSVKAPTGPLPSLRSAVKSPTEPVTAIQAPPIDEPLSLESTQPDQPRAPSQTMAIAPVIDRGPTSETMVVALPDADPAAGLTTDPGSDLDLAVTVSRTGTRPGVPPAPSAVPLAVPMSSSAPTDIGAAIVDPALIDDRTGLDALAPEPATSPEARAAPEPDPDPDPAAEPTTSPGPVLIEPLTEVAAAPATDPTGAVVDPTSPDEDASARTQVHAGVPPREPFGQARAVAQRPADRDPATSARVPAFPTLRGAPIDLTQTMRSPPPEMDEIRALLASDRRPMSSERKPEVDDEGTDLSMVPPPPVAVSETPSQRARRTAMGVAVTPEAEAPASVSGSISAPAVPEAGAPRLPSDGLASALGAASVLGAPDDGVVEPLPLSGVAPSLPVPAPIGATSVIIDDAVAIGEEPTGAERVLADDDGVDVTTPTRRPDGKLAAPVEEPTPSEYWTISPDGSLASKPKDPNRPRSNSSQPIAADGRARTPSSGPVVADARTRTPSGPVADARPRTPSGPVVADARPRTPSGPVATDARAPASGPVAAPAQRSGPTPAPRPGPTPAPVPGEARAPGRIATVIGPPAVAKAPAQPASNGHAAPAVAAPPAPSGPAAVAASEAPAPLLPSGDWLIALDPGAPDGWSEPVPTGSSRKYEDPPADGEPPRRPSLRADELPVAEPKVQIDPTLIEPLSAVAEEAYSRPSVPAMPMYGPPGFAPMPTPMVPMAIPPTPPPPGFHGAPAYPMDPAYQMVPVATLPRPATADGSGLGYASDHAIPAGNARRRRIIIVLVTAIVAVAIGIYALAALSRHRDGPPAEPPTPAPTTSEAPAHPGPAPTPDETHASVAPAATAPPAASPPPEAAPAAATECFADVVTVPAGAEIVLGDANVVGTSPQRVALPCGDKLELTVRKAHLVSQSRTITPTPDGVKVRIALAKQTVQVKVSSTPAGATITLAGKPLGVTPTTIKVPAFETSTLNITRDGYAAETEKVAPRSNGTAVHLNLKKLERRPR